MAQCNRAVRFTKPKDSFFCGEWRQKEASGPWYFFSDEEVADMENRGLTVAEFLLDEHLAAAA